MRILLSCLVLIAFGLSGCQSAYYGTMEKLGVHKREILVDRIEDSRDSQLEAQEQFKDALEEFRSVVEVDGGDLEKMYDRLSDELSDSEAAADEIDSRIDRVEDVADALFDEWTDEIEDYSSAKLKRSSQNQLRDTRRHYESLLKTMRRAQKSMDPVLANFRDQVLFLKHNLNASAIASIRGEFDTISVDIQRLISQMQRSIDESDAFIRRLKG